MPKPNNILPADRYLFRKTLKKLRAVKAPFALEMALKFNCNPRTIEEIVSGRKKRSERNRIDIDAVHNYFKDNYVNKL